MIKYFNIRNNDWDLFYPHHSVHTDTLREITNNIDWFTFLNQVPTRYTDNSNKSNLVIDLMFLWVNSEELDIYIILSNLWSPFNYTFITVEIIINEEFI